MFFRVIDPASRVCLMFFKYLILISLPILRKPSCSCLKLILINLSQIECFLSGLGICKLKLEDKLLVGFLNYYCYFFPRFG